MALSRVGKAIPLRSRVSFARERQLNFAIALSDSDFATLSHFPGANPSLSGIFLHNQSINSIISKIFPNTNLDNRPATLEILHKLEETETVHATCSVVLAQVCTHMAESRFSARVFRVYKIMYNKFKHISYVTIKLYTH